MTKEQFKATFGINTMGEAMDLLKTLYMKLLGLLAHGPITKANQTEYEITKDLYVDLCKVIIHHPNTTPAMREKIEVQLKVLKYTLE